MPFALNTTLSCLVSDVSSTIRRPTRMGQLPAGVLVINDSTVSRVWIAPSAGVGPGAGTPVDPKTTIRLTVDGDWYAVLDSAATVAAQLWLTPHVEDWNPSPIDIATASATATATAILQTGIVLIDVPFVAARQNLTSGVEQTAFFNVAASKYQSYQIKLNFSNGAATAANYATVELRFYDDQSNIVWRDIVQINPGNVDTYITDRMHGAVMTVLPTFPGGTLAIDWLYSNRPADRFHFMESPAGADRLLMSRTSLVVGAGVTSADQFCPAFMGPAQIALDNNAALNGTWNFYFGSVAGPAFKIPFNPGTSSGFLTNVLLPCRPLRYTITNTGAGSGTFFTSVWVNDN